ncbi:MAG: WD40 repeat domain-containing protein [Anaerolineae bacterium]|nr:WD40 repeat domain-containing protein [Anaerolineae bacterium]
MNTRFLTSILLVLMMLSLLSTPVAAQNNDNRDIEPMLTFEHGHDDFHGAAWSNNHILTWGTVHGIARLWSLDGQLLATLELCEYGFCWIAEARWNVDESRLFTVICYQGGCHTLLWDANGRELAELPGWHAKWNTDGTRAFTEFNSDRYCSENCMYEIHVWDADGNPLATLRHNSHVSAKWNVNGTHILAVSNSWPEACGEICLYGTGCTENCVYEVRIWDVNGELLATLVHDYEIYNAIWNSDETQILTWSNSPFIADESLRYEYLWAIWVECNYISEDCFNPFGWSAKQHSGYAVRNGVHQAQIWSTDGELLTTLSHGAEIWGAAWNPDETRVLTWTRDGTGKVWSTSGEELFTITQAHWARWSTDGTRILAWSLIEEDAAQVWSDEGRLLLTVHPNVTEWDELLTAEWNRDETRILTWGWDGLRVWSVEHSDNLLTLRPPRGGSIPAEPFERHWNPEQTLVLVDYWIVGWVWIWDVIEGNELFVLSGYGRSYGLKWLQDKAPPPDRRCGKRVCMVHILLTHIED